jgi:hypothetical protein
MFYIKEHMAICFEWLASGTDEKVFTYMTTKGVLDYAIFMDLIGLHNHMNKALAVLKTHRIVGDIRDEVDAFAHPRRLNVVLMQTTYDGVADTSYEGPPSDHPTYHMFHVARELFLNMAYLRKSHELESVRETLLKRCERGPDRPHPIQILHGDSTPLTLPTEGPRGGLSVPLSSRITHYTTATGAVIPRDWSDPMGEEESLPTR